MIYQREKVAYGETEAIYRVITDPAQILLEYRIIALETPKASAFVPEEYCCKDLYSDIGERYCILIIASDRFGSTETKFLYDVTRDKSIAETLLKTLYEGAVTPCTAKYVIEDLL